MHRYTFKSIIDEADTTFNRLRGFVVYPDREEFAFALLAFKNFRQSHVAIYFLTDEVT